MLYKRKVARPSHRRGGVWENLMEETSELRIEGYVFLPAWGTKQKAWGCSLYYSRASSHTHTVLYSCPWFFSHIYLDLISTYLPHRKKVASDDAILLPFRFKLLSLCPLATSDTVHFLFSFFPSILSPLVPLPLTECRLLSSKAIFCKLCVVNHL